MKQMGIKNETNGYQDGRQSKATKKTTAATIRESPPVCKLLATKKCLDCQSSHPTYANNMGLRKLRKHLMGPAKSFIPFSHGILDRMGFRRVRDLSY